jgi:hypothetical protein
LSKIARLLAAALISAALTGCETPPPHMEPGMMTTVPGSMPTVLPVTITGDQILVELEAQRPDGGPRKIWAVVNMGHARPMLQKHLYQELEIDRGRRFSFRLGDIPISVDASLVLPLDDAAYPARQVGPFFFSQNVEAVLQADTLEQFEIVLDYADKTMTLAKPGSLKLEGVAVPIRVNQETGLAVVDLTIDGTAFPVVIDCGGGYTWLRPSVIAKFLAAHPSWKRTDGAVGLSNYNMLDYAFEKQGTVVRLPDAMIGSMPVKELGVMATGPALGWPLDYWFREIVFDLWQKNAPEPVIGWLGANVLKHFKLTIDYQNRMSYWLKKDDLDAHELDQIGVTLVYRKGEYFVGGIVTKAGNPTVVGLEIGDKIVGVDDKKTVGWSRDQIFAALHGHAGDSHRLAVERDGKSMEFALPVTEF